MNRFAWILILLFTLGLIILVLPDKDSQVIKINEQHGPSLFDLVGLFLILLGWTGSSIFLIRQWRSMVQKSGKQKIYILIIMYFLFLIGIIIALTISLDWMLWLFTAGAFLVNVQLVILAFQTRKTGLNI